MRQASDACQNILGSVLPLSKLTLDEVGCSNCEHATVSGHDLMRRRVSTGTRYEFEEKVYLSSIFFFRYFNCSQVTPPGALAKSKVQSRGFHLLPPSKHNFTGSCTVKPAPNTQTAMRPGAASRRTA